MNIKNIIVAVWVSIATIKIGIINIGLVRTPKAIKVIASAMRICDMQKSTTSGLMSNMSRHILISEVMASENTKNIDKDIDPNKISLEILSSDEILFTSNCHASSFEIIETKPALKSMLSSVWYLSLYTSRSSKDRPDIFSQGTVIAAIENNMQHSTRKKFPFTILVLQRRR
jgi:hypothetical protein